MQLARRIRGETVNEIGFRQQLIMKEKKKHNESFEVEFIALSDDNMSKIKNKLLMLCSAK